MIPKWTCEQCGKIFERKLSGRKLPRFCSNACCALWRKENKITAGCFKKGHVSWNKGRKGIHMSPETEFKPGCVPANKCVVGTVKIRTRKRDGQQHAWIKIAEPNVWEQRHRLVWEEKHGPLPKGFVIHRHDGDSLNDDIKNLLAMSRADHLMLHLPEFEEKLRAAQSKAQKARWKEYRESKFDTYYWQPEAVPSEAELAEIRRAG